MTQWNIGDQVWVYSFGHWYLGTVTKLSAKRVWVTYTTGTNTTREKPYNQADTRLSKAVGRGVPGYTPRYPFKRVEEATA
jgi:hypothetical protein